MIFVFVLLTLMFVAPSFSFYRRALSRRVLAVRLSGRAKRAITETEELQRLYSIEERCLIDDRIPDIVNRNAEYFQRFVETRSNHLHSSNVEAFVAARNFVDNFYSRLGINDEKRIVLDSGCGQGLSTVRLSALYPNMPCIGVDRSLNRLKSNKHFDSSVNGDEEAELADMQKNVNTPANLFLIRADLLDFWILSAIQSDWIIEHHYIFHPNPCSKYKNIKQRFYANSIFPVLPILGGSLHLRSNWKTYTNEFRESFEILKKCPGFECFNEVAAQDVHNYDTSVILSHFDRKYAQVGTPMYDLEINFPLSNSESRRLWWLKFRQTSPATVEL